MKTKSDKKKLYAAGGSFIWFKLVLAILFLSLWTVSESTAQTYNWNSVATGCDGKTALIGTLTSPDFPQDATWQDAQWNNWKATYPGLADSDRLGNATLTYNCHSYIFHNGIGWLNDPTNYKGSNTGCWEQDTNGTIRSSGTYHSCTSGYVGKCGNAFFQSRNDLVYGTVTPRYTKK